MTPTFTEKAREFKWTEVECENCHETVASIDLDKASFEGTTYWACDACRKDFRMRSKEPRKRPGYMGDIAGPGCDPDVP
jgi:hypothetical protein